MLNFIFMQMTLLYTALAPLTALVQYRPVDTCNYHCVKYLIPYPETLINADITPNISCLPTLRIGQKYSFCGHSCGKLELEYFDDFKPHGAAV